MSRDELRKQQIDHIFGPMSKDEFVNRYIENQWSLPDFKKNVGYDYRTTEFLCHFFGIEKRTMSDAHNERAREKRKAAYITNWGVENPSQHAEIKAKKQKTFASRYGVDNVFKSQDFKEWLALYMMETYGKGSLAPTGPKKGWKNQTPDKKKEIAEKSSERFVRWWSSLTPEQRQAEVKRRTEKTKKNLKPGSSKLEGVVAAALIELGISIKPQHWVAKRSYDLKIMDTNLLIEINGDYWHGNPEKYPKGTIIRFPEGREMLVDELWQNDANKIALAESYGYRVLTLWEKDILANRNALPEWLLGKLTTIDR